jgi:hypothetical protein
MIRSRLGRLIAGLVLVSLPATAGAADLACRLDALGPAERDRHEKLLGELEKSVREVRELPDGYAFRLPAESKLLARVGEWISLERRCCPFFDFELRWSSNEEAPWLRLTGSQEVKAFLAETDLVRR